MVVDRLTKQAHFIAFAPRFTAPQVFEIFIKEIVHLLGVPISLISDCDPLFMSLFWPELFRLQGTKLAMSTAYHPQSDGQTEVVNRYLEDYLRSFVSDQPRLWLRYLPWAEWHYNTAWHSSIRMTPYEAIFGRPPPTLLDYITGTSRIAVVEEVLEDRSRILRILKQNLANAQRRMKTQADTK